MSLLSLLLASADLSGFDHSRCGVVWCDAHGDFNTPETTITGLFPGMSLAVITGHCYQNYWAQIGNSTPIAEAATLMLGVRDLDPAERERLESSAIRVVQWQEGKPQSDVRSALVDYHGISPPWWEFHQGNSPGVSPR